MTDTGTNAVLVALRVNGEATADEIADAALLCKRHAIRVLRQLGPQVHRELRLRRRAARTGPGATWVAFYRLAEAT